MHYNYALTFYIWPIDGELCLSRKFGFYIKNPDENQIDEIITFMRSNYRIGMQISGDEPEIRDLEFLFKKFRSISKRYEKKLSVKFKGESKNLWDFVARNLLIIKMDKNPDDVGYKPTSKPTDELDSRDSVIFDILNAYISILDLYNGKFNHHYTNSLSVTSFYGLGSIPNHRNFVWLTIINFMISVLHTGNLEDDDGARFMHPKLAFEDIVNAASKLEEHDLTQNLDKMYGLGSMIYAAFSEIRNYDLKVLLITSMLEFLTVRNPDTSRFNVDDSINKQFQLKTAMMLNKADQNVNLVEVKKTLKLMYSYRSSIAHGSYIESRKLLRTNKIDLLDLQHEAGLLLNKCFTVYINNFEFADFLKES